MFDPKEAARVLALVRQSPWLDYQHPAPHPDEPASFSDSERKVIEAALEQAARPIPMLLFCPACGEQHIDAPKPEIGWDDPPHRSHQCQFCPHTWRPADVPTTGVAEIQTRGKVDGSADPKQAARRVIWLQDFDGDWCLSNGERIIGTVDWCPDDARWLVYIEDAGGFRELTPFYGRDGLDSAKAAVEKALQQSEGNDG